MRAMLLERIVLSNKVEKKAGPITKAGRGVVRSVSGAGDQKIKGADRSRRAFRCLAAPSSCFILGRHGGLACLESLERRRPSPLYAGPGGAALGFEAGRGGRLSRTSLASSQIDRCGPGVVADPGSSLTLPCALIVSSLGEGLDFFNSAGFSPIHTCDSLLHRGSHVIQLWLNEGPCLVHSIMHRLYLLSQLRQSWLTSANAIPA